MTPEQWKQVSDLVEQALAEPSAARRQGRAVTAGTHV
jgi:hypothetical protein